MDLRDHFRVVWRRKWAVLASAALVSAVVYAFFANKPKVYQAQAQLSVIPRQVTTGVGAAQSEAVFLAATYAQLAKTAPVVQAALGAAQLRVDEPTAAKRLSVDASSTVGFLSVSATGPSPRAAVALARGEVDALIAAVTAQQEAALAAQLKKIDSDINGVSSRLSSLPAGSTQLASLQAQLRALEQVAADRQSQPFDELNVVAPARAGGAPVSPKPKTDALLGFVTAVVVNSELAVLLEALSDRFPADRLEEEVTTATGLTVLAHVPAGEGPGVTEASHKMRTSLLFMRDAERVRTVAIVSNEPGAGKSFISVNLALAVAELGVSVVVVDGDMRRPVIHDRLGVPRSPGLSEVLGGAEATVGVHPVVAHPGLMAMPAGGEVPDPSGLLAGGLSRHVLLPLSTVQRTSIELVVLDSPPESLFPDALTIAAQCDATILVVDAAGSRRRALRRTLDHLRQVGARPLGIVLNRSSQVEASSYYYAAYGRRPSRRAAHAARDL